VYTVFKCDSLWEKIADMRFRPFSVGKFVVCGNDPQHFRTNVPTFCLRSFSHKCIRTDSGEFDNWDWCISRDSHFKTSYMMQHLYQSLSQWSLWPWSLTLSYSNCQFLQYLWTSAISANTQWYWPVSLTTAYNLMLSGITTIKNINIHSSALKQTSK
jgi:hypothetical protein